MKTMGTLGMLVGIVAMASTALGSVRHVNCDVPGQTITKALKTYRSLAWGVWRFLWVPTTPEKPAY